MNLPSRPLVLLLLLGLFPGLPPAWGGEAAVGGAQTIEQTELIIYGQYFDDIIAGQVEWRKKALKATSEPKSVLLLTEAIARWSSKEPPLKLHHRLGRVSLEGFEYGDNVTRRLQPELEKDSFGSLISRNREIRKLPLGQFSTPSGKVISIVNDDANSRKAVFALSRVGFSRNGRQALFSSGYSFYLYKIEDGRWKQVKWFPYAVD